jgi:hypothetical protein
MRWSVGCEVQVWSVECGVWRAQCEVWRKCSLGVVALRPGRAQIMFLDNNTATASKKNAHTRAWLAHRARKFYRWERSYNITLRQLPPRLVRVLLVHQWIQCEVHQLKTVNFWSMVMWWWWIVGARLVGKWVINGSKRCVKWVIPSYTCIIPMLFETWSTHW